MHLPGTPLLDSVLELMNSELPVINDREELRPVLIVGAGNVFESLLMVSLLEYPLFFHALKPLPEPLAVGLAFIQVAVDLIDKRVPLGSRSRVHICRLMYELLDL